MSTVVQHINSQSYLFDTPKNRVRLGVRIFILRFFINWYVRRLDILRTEILGVISLIEKQEIIFDYKSYIIFRKIFRMVYTFNEILAQEKSPNFFNVKISLQSLCDSLQTLLLAYEKENFADHNEGIDIVQDDHDWTNE